MSIAELKKNIEIQPNDTSKISIKPLFIAIALVLFGVSLELIHPNFQVGNFIPLHLIIELISVVISFAIFITGLYGYQQTRNSGDIFLSLTFYLAGIFDLVHAMSYKGMPDFLTTGTVGLAAAYWMASRFTLGTGIILAATVNYNDRRNLNPGIYVGVVTLTALLVITAFTRWSLPISNALYDDFAGRLTTFKVVMEYLIILIFAFGIKLVSLRVNWDDRTKRLLRSALIIAIGSELFFSWYKSPYDSLNFTGHLLKTLSYLVILNALFSEALQRPYLELSHARDRLRELYSDAKQSRNELEVSFARIGMALSASVKVNEATRIIAKLAREISKSDCAVISTFLPGGLESQQECSGGIGPCPRLLQLSTEFSREAAAKSDTYMVDFDEGRECTVCEKGGEYPIRHVLAEPLFHEGKLLASIVLFRRSNEEFKAREIKLINAFAYHAGIALNNALSYEREERIASILQESITRISDIANTKFDIAHLYIPLMEEASVGGDFLDVINLSDGHIALAIGDVAGKGLKAAVHTAMVKYALRAFLSENHPPATATQSLEKLVSGIIEQDKFISLFVGVLNTVTGQLTYANAGHEPPILCKNGICGNLAPTGPALGLGFDSGFEQDSIMLERGDLLLMFTDGLVERGGGNPDFNAENVAMILAQKNELSCRSIVDSLYNASKSSESGAPRDDVAVLAVKAL